MCAPHFQTARGLVRAVDGVSLTLERGKALGIVGESGSGKTILSRSIMGLLPVRGTIRQGSVRFEGREIGGLSRKAMRDVWGKEMAMIFQDPMTSLNPLMKIGAQIAEPLRLHLDMSKSDAWATAERLMQDVRIPAPGRRLNQYPHEMSGGMRQRIMIAIAMACGPTLLLADEPTTALDVTVQAQILELLGEQRRERNMSLVLVTHDLGVVAGHTDDIGVMYGGKLVEMAPTAELFANMKMPYTEALLQSIPKIGDAEPHAAQRHQWSTTRLGESAGRMPIRATLSLRPGTLPRRGAPADGHGRGSSPYVRLLVPRRFPRVPRDEGAASARGGGGCLMAGTGKAHLRDRG